MRLEETGYAKINLALHVRRRRADGFHDIETLFAFARDGDIITAEPADDLTLVIDGPFAKGLEGDDPATNLVLRAGVALREAGGLQCGARLRLTKTLPVAAGIGGGSADAAAALRLLSRLWQIDPANDRVLAIARRLGADVPACLRSEFVRGEGRGDDLSPLAGDALAGMPLLLVNPGVQLSTASVFAAWDGTDGGSLAKGAPLSTALEGRNDLEQPAVGLRPVIGEVLDALRGQRRVVMARMSGSGATCFALFDDDASMADAAARIAAEQPRWWQLATALQ